MKPVKDRILLLTLLNIYFIYKIIAGVLDGNQSDILLWSLIMIVYVISLVILYFVIKRSSKT
ncbi:MAG: hypothetical protein JXA99_09950 [Candidatus Lokiarchaeota archaeon]|nr:hypothetical protein [Candidatus Lokiarchaeota archaeon]